MAGYILVGCLAAFGALSALWAVLGWLLPQEKGLCMVCLEEADVGTVSRVRWLWGLGLLRCPLLVVTEEGQLGVRMDGTEICRPGDLLSRLEREKTDGTGNGDPSGHHQCRGISEL